MNGNKMLMEVLLTKIGDIQKSINESTEALTNERVSHNIRLDSLKNEMREFKNRYEEKQKTIDKQREQLTELETFQLELQLRIDKPTPYGF